MEFGWNETQQARYQQIVEQVKSVIVPMSEARGIESYLTLDEWRACGDIGLHGLSVPEKFGGKGLGWLDTARCMEAFGYASEDAGLPFAVGANLFAVEMPVAEFADESLAREFLPGLCSGELVGANAITEPGSGSDVYALQMLAAKDGDDYILNGTKSYISNAPIADLFIVYATTNPKYGFLGVTAFLVDAKTEGLTVEAPFTKSGLKSVPGAVAHFENCRVPAWRRVGQEGQGGSIFNRSMQWERSCLTALFLGVMERQLERLVSFTKERRQFGKPIATFQGVSHTLTQMKQRLDASKLLLYRGCWLAEQGKDASAEISMAKVQVTESAVAMGVEGTQLLGGIGIQGYAGMERTARDAMAACTASGSANMQREILARGMGL